jgi:hypothetical protein
LIAKKEAFLLARNNDSLKVIQFQAPTPAPKR